MTTQPAGARLAVIGGGPGGYPAAFLAADMGMQVTLIDEEPNPGGVCLYRGCIPSKALLHVAALIEEAELAKDWGVAFGEPTVDLDRLRGFKQGVVDRLTGGLGQLSGQHKVNYVQGRATFLDAHTLSIAPAEGSDAPPTVEFDHAIIATGSSPTRIPALDIGSPRVLDSTSALELERVPETLLVVGGGYIGLELGSVYAALGSRVTVVEMTAGLLPGVDRDLVRQLQRKLRRSFEAIRLETTVLGMEETDDGVRARIAGNEGEPEEHVFDQVLVAVGRRPNSAALGLERTDVQVDARGFIEADAQRRTAESHIFAVGDVAGEPMLAHKASHEATVAVETIAGKPATWGERTVPAVIYTDPEIAWAGLTETEATDQRIQVEVSTMPWAASGRATTLGRNDGATKLVLEPHTHRVLGVGIVGAGAGELISEAVLAIEMGAVAQDLELTIHPHPTLSETLMHAAAAFYGRSPDYIGRRRR
ncbi:MAG: dihydrolipoyl dehydrogenase [Chloroflexi bacterium]|nr:dihydrolipoyl dehydrogenase [Chloroflexota bacterium]